MSKHTSMDAPRTSRIEASPSQGEMRTDSKKNISGNKSIYIAKKHIELKFEKIKRSFSSLIFGEKASKEMHAERIRHIKQKINYAKSIPNTSTNRQASNANVRERDSDNKSQRREIHQERPASAKEGNNPRLNNDSRRGIPAVLPQTIIIQQTVTTLQVPNMPPALNMQQPQYMQLPIATQEMQYTQQPAHNPPPGMMATPAIPAYVNASALPPASYFQHNWYPPMSSSAPSTRANMGSTRPDSSEGRPVTNTRFTDTSARPVRQNYRLGNQPDSTAFYQKLSKELKTQLSPLSQMTTTQKLHVLSHMMYSGEIPNYPDERMKDAPFQLINKIEQLRLDYVPNANDGSANIYKVIFNNLIRNDIVETLPQEIRRNFESADEEYQTNGDFNGLINTYNKLISDATNQTSGTASAERRQAKPGELTSEWMAKMNQSLSPYREQIENWSDLEKYQAMLYLLRDDKAEFSKNTKVKAWIDGIDLIRKSDIHDANNYDKRNEQKVFFNNNLRTVLRNNLPEDFQEKFNEINEKFLSMDISSQAKAYQNYLDEIKSIVREEINKLTNT